MSVNICQKHGPHAAHWPCPKCERGPLKLEAIFAKATTMVDSGWRISFDLSEQAPVEELAKLRGKCLHIVIVAEEDEVYERP